MKEELSYPQVRLTIKDQIPRIELLKSEADVSTMLEMQVGIDSLLMKVAKRLGVAKADSAHIFELIREGDEQYLEFDSEAYDDDNLEFAALIKKIDSQPEFDAGVEVNAAVNKALLENWQADVLASVLEHIYATLIAKTVYAASEMGIGNIVLADDRHEVRLQEKMAKELALAEIELVVI